MIKKIIAVLCFIALVLSCSVFSRGGDESNNDVVYTYEDYTMSSYYLKLGKLEKPITIKSNGASKLSASSSDTSTSLTISKDKLQYPTLKVESVCMKDNAQNEFFISVNEKDIQQLFKSINEVDCVGFKDEMTDDLNLDTYYGLEAYIVTKMPNNTYLTIDITQLDNNYQYIYFYKDSTTDYGERVPITKSQNEYSFIRTNSRKIKQILETMIGWKEGSPNDLSAIKKITMVDSENKTTVLTDSQTQKIKKYLYKSHKVDDDDVVVDFYTLLCELQDGSTIKIGLSGSYLIFEGSVYLMDNDGDMDQIMTIIEE